MTLMIGILIGITTGRLRGGRIRGLADLSLRYTWFPIALFGVQAVFLKLPLREYGWALTFTPLMLVVTYVLLVGWLLLNRAVPGILLILTGALLNLTVIAVNDGYMPITADALARAGHADRILIHENHAFVAGSKDIVLAVDDTDLWLLSDVLVIPDEYPFATSFSLGDVLISAGAGWLAYAAVRRGGDEKVEVRAGARVESGRWIARKEEADA